MGKRYKPLKVPKKNTINLHVGKKKFNFTKTWESKAIILNNQIREDFWRWWPWVQVQLTVKRPFLHTASGTANRCSYGYFCFRTIIPQEHWFYYLPWFLWVMNLGGTQHGQHAFATWRLESGIIWGRLHSHVWRSILSVSRDLSWAVTSLCGFSAWAYSWAWRGHFLLNFLV